MLDKVLEELRSQLNSSTTIEEKLGAYITATTKIKAIYPEETISLLEEAFPLLDIHPSEYHRAYFLQNMGTAKTILNQLEEASQHADAALEIWVKLANKQEIANVYNLLGVINKSLGNYGVALSFWQNCPEIFNEIGDVRGLASVYNNIAATNNQLGNFAEALEFYQKCPDLFEQANYKEGVAISLTNIGIVYENLKDYEKSLEFHQKSIEILEEIGEPRRLAQSLHNTAATLRLLKQNDEALEKALKSLEISEKNKYKLEIANTYRLLSALYRELNNSKESIKYSELSLELSKETNDVFKIISSLIETATTYRTFEKTTKTEEYLKEALKRCEEIQAKELLFKTHEELALFYKEKKNYKKALEHYEKFHNLENVVFNEKSDEQIQSMRVLHDVAQKEKEAEIYKLKNIELASFNERLQELNDEKNEFLGIAAHDLKNPLASIMLTASMVKEYHQRLNPEKLVKEMNKIEDIAKRMRSIISNLLDVNAIETGKMNLNYEVLDGNEILNDVIGDYIIQSKQKDITLHFNNDADNSLIKVDKNSLHEILENVVSNSVKYSPKEKSIWVRAFVATGKALQFPTTLSNQEYYVVSVKDEGPGISVEDQKKLFSKFGKLSAKPTGGESSTGLGLSIVKKLAEMMQGHVWCESTFGEGATFFTAFPISHS
jgi:signal transduction histidine kinase